MLVEFLREKLNEISKKEYDISKERNVDADLTKNQIVVSALSGTIYKDSATIPYQIDIVTNDIESVMIDFTTIARNYNNVSFTKVIKNDEEEYESHTITSFFNTPVVAEKDIPMGSEKYARLIVFATVNEKINVNNIKSIKIDGEELELLNASITYTTELHSNRKSGKFLNRSRMKTASCALSFTAINKSTPFFNRAFKVFSGELSGNTGFSLEITLDNALKANFRMLIGTYTISTEMSKLPSVSVGMFLLDEGDN